VINDIGPSLPGLALHRIAGALCDTPRIFADFGEARSWAVIEWLQASEAVHL
jgi:hypothetical protein